MPDPASAHIICIVPKLGAHVGGGKVNAVFKRMNLLANRAATRVTLLNLQHGCNQKIAFADLIRGGRLDPRIAHRSIHELCVPDAPVAADADTALPDWDDHKTAQGAKTRITYFKDGTPVMRDGVEPTSAGDLTVRRVLGEPDRDVRLKYLNGELIESRVEFGDGIVEKTVFADGAPRCRTRRENGAFVWVRDFGLDRTFKDDVTHHRMLVARHFPPDSIVFIDGVTSAYLSRPIPAQKVLFLHADHRNASGKVVPRSRGLIEAFDGDAIVTATHVHKRRLEQDTTHRAPIRVIPHYTDVTPGTGKTP